jgi:hypothetical protein
MNNVAMLHKLVLVALGLTIQAANMNMHAGYGSDTQAATEG